MDQEDTQRLFIMELRQLATIQYPLREQYREPALRRLLRGNVRQDIIGCRHQEAKPVGAWLMQEHMLAEADMAVTPHHMDIRTILPRRKLPEGITAVVSLGILSVKSALMALALEVSHGTDQNALHSLPQVILEEATIIIIPPT